MACRLTPEAKANAGLIDLPLILSVIASSQHATRKTLMHLWKTELKTTCPFCCPDSPVIENTSTYAVYDLYPVNRGHLLVIPRRHYSYFFESTKEDLDGILDLVWRGRELIDELYRPDGYNIGANVGLASGQTIMHLHVHLIPRFIGDVDDPTGRCAVLSQRSRNIRQRYNGDIKEKDLRCWVMEGTNSIMKKNQTRS